MTEQNSSMEEKGKENGALPFLHNNDSKGKLTQGQRVKKNCCSINRNTLPLKVTLFLFYGGNKKTKKKRFICIWNEIQRRKRSVDI